MGGNHATMNIHICGLDKNDKEFYESQMNSLNILFPNEDKIKSTLNYTVKYSKKPKWNSFIYTDNNAKNFKLISQTIQDKINIYNKEIQNKKITEEEKAEFKNHMILLYVTDNHSDSLFCQVFNDDNTIDTLIDNYPLILFIFKNIDRNNSYYKDMFFDYSYIRCLNLDSFYKNPDIEKSKKKDFLALSLKSFLYKYYDSYFTERGLKIIDEIDPLSNKFVTGIYLSIVLVGSPGVGKSTFVNIINGGRISKASSSDDPVTSKSSYYDIKIPGQKKNKFQDNDEELNQEAFIRFIDTPGFDEEKDIDIALKEIKTMFKNFKDGKENIPIILYFMNPIGRNSTKDDNKKSKMVEILKFLSKNNAKIIFVITHMPKNTRWKKQSSFINSLKENGLEKLVENDKSNIIKCELLGDNAYGIQDIFKKIYIYLNVLKDEKGNPTGEVYTDSFIEEIKKFETFDQKLNYMKTKTNLFDQFESHEDIIKFAAKKSNFYISSMMVSAGVAGLVPIAFADISFIISIIGKSIIQIGKYYGYVWKKIGKKDLKAILKGELYKENNDDNTVFNNRKEFLKIISELLLKSLGTLLLLTLDDIIKTVWGIGTIVGITLGSVVDVGIVYKYLSNAKNYFESKCKNDDGTIFFTTRCIEYEIIFRAFKQFEKFDLIYPNQ